MGADHWRGPQFENGWEPLVYTMPNKIWFKLLSERICRGAIVGSPYDEAHLSGKILLWALLTVRRWRSGHHLHIQLSVFLLCILPSSESFRISDNVSRLSILLVSVFSAGGKVFDPFNVETIQKRWNRSMLSSFLVRSISSFIGRKYLWIVRLADCPLE